MKFDYDPNIEQFFVNRIIGISEFHKLLKLNPFWCVKKGDRINYANDTYEYWIQKNYFLICLAGLVINLLL